MTGSYLDGLRLFYSDIEAARTAETDPRRRAILENYFRHVTLEGTEHWREIFTIEPPMLSPRPTYRTNVYGQFAVDDGVDAIMAHYENGTAQRPVIIINHVFWVNDWGVASRSQFVRFLSGAEAIAQGLEVDHPEGSYVQTFPLGMFWPYDDQALLIGEDVYQLEAAQLIEIDPLDVVTIPERSAVAMSFLQSWFDPETLTARE